MSEPIPEVHDWRELAGRPESGVIGLPTNREYIDLLKAGDALCDLVERQQEELRLARERIECAEQDAADLREEKEMLRARALEAERQRDEARKEAVEWRDAWLRSEYRYSADDFRHENLLPWEVSEESQ